jgi:hypothetical protein
MSAQILFKKNYLAMVRNAARGENNMFRNFYIVLDGQERDALKDGGLGCGTFVSSVLYLQNSSLEFMGRSNWISFTHANVIAVEKDIEANGWKVVDELKEGALVTWESKPGEEGVQHLHMGFYVGNERAISNGSNTTHMPEEHHFTYDGTRKIIRIWWHTVLDED